MAEPFLGEIRIMSFNFAPKGWALCNGQLLPINQNQALFSLLGTTYGGDGRVNFGLPNLRGGRRSMSAAAIRWARRAASRRIRCRSREMPTHTHVASGVNVAAGTADPTTALLAQPSQALGSVYRSPPTALGAMNPASIGNVGGSQAHLNMQPFLTLNFCIALQGIFPSPN